jgi:hypothetical protein
LLRRVVHQFFAEVIVLSKGHHAANPGKYGSREIFFNLKLKIKRQWA